MRQTPHAYAFGASVSCPQYGESEEGQGVVLPHGMRLSSMVSAMGTGAPPRERVMQYPGVGEVDQLSVDACGERYLHRSWERAIHVVLRDEVAKALCWLHRKSHVISD